MRLRLSLNWTKGTCLIRLALAVTVVASLPLRAEDPPDASRDEPKKPVLQESIIVKAPPRYVAKAVTSATRTETPLREVPQSIDVVTHELIQDQLMSGIGDVVRYVPGVTLHQGENNRDQIVMRGNGSSADFFLDGVRDDVQYYRDLYNLDRVEVLKGPNALIFGRGGAGGVINRVTKEAGFTRLREITLNAGAFDNKRVALDFDQPLGDSIALRLNGVHESSGSFRDHVSLSRSGIAPAVTFLTSDRTLVTLGYENFHDRRVADRGISSFQGRPAAVGIDTYYGNPDDSHVRANVNLGWAGVEHRAGRLAIRNRTLFGDYGRNYQNYVPGAVSPDQTFVALTAYNNATDRRNLFDQFDVTGSAKTGALHHTFVFGADGGQQSTKNFRNTGYFNNSATTIFVPFANPMTTTPVTFRQNATDADNNVRATTISAFAQDQVDVTQRLKLIGGLRLERFRVDYRNNRTGLRLDRIDAMLSPRAGLIFNVIPALSAYASYSVSHLPSSGDQFSSLTNTTQQMKPERFDNYELGAKWDTPGGLSLTSAIYRLDRTNTRSTDPNDPSRIVQTGSQRSNGFELAINGNVTSAWSVAGGYAYQDAFVTSATAVARAGAKTAQTPHHMLSLWNNYKVTERFGAALGMIHRSSMFATIDNTVTLPGYTEIDTAAFLSLTEGVRFQVNIENLFDTTYYRNADSNTNISPGSPRAVRIALLSRF